PRAVVDDEISDAPGRAREEHPLEPGAVLLHEVGRGMRRARQGVVDSLARIEPLRRLDGAVTPLRGALARCLVAESLVAILDRFASARLGGSFRLRLGRVRRGECLTCLLAGAAGATRLFLLLGHRRLYTTSDAVGDKPLVHPRYLRRGRRPSSSGFGEAFASTGAAPECTKPSTLDGLHGGLRPAPLARERRTRSERPWVLEHRSAAPLPRGLGEAKARDRRASWSVKIPAMTPRHLILAAMAPVVEAGARRPGE